MSNPTTRRLLSLETHAVPQWLYPVIGLELAPILMKIYSHNMHLIRSDACKVEEGDPFYITYPFFQSHFGLSHKVIRKHLTKLEEYGLITIHERDNVGRVHLTINDEAIEKLSIAFYECIYVRDDWNPGDFIKSSAIPNGAGRISKMDTRHTQTGTACHTQTGDHKDKDTSIGEAGVRDAYASHTDRPVGRDPNSCATHTFPRRKVAKNISPVKDTTPNVPVEDKPIITPRKFKPMAQRMKDARKESMPDDVAEENAEVRELFDYWMSLPNVPKPKKNSPVRKQAMIMIRALLDGQVGPTKRYKVSQEFLDAWDIPEKLGKMTVKRVKGMFDKYNLAFDKEMTPSNKNHLAKSLPESIYCKWGNTSHLLRIAYNPPIALWEERANQVLGTAGNDLREPTLEIMRIVNIANEKDAEASVNAQDMKNFLVVATEIVDFFDNVEFGNRKDLKDRFPYTFDLVDKYFDFIKAPANKCTFPDMHPNYFKPEKACMKKFNAYFRRDFKFDLFDEENLA